MLPRPWFYHLLLALDHQQACTHVGHSVRLFSMWNQQYIYASPFPLTFVHASIPSESTPVINIQSTANSPPIMSGSRCGLGSSRGGFGNERGGASLCCQRKYQQFAPLAECQLAQQGCQYYWPQPLATTTITTNKKHPTPTTIMPPTAKSPTPNVQTMTISVNSTRVCVRLRIMISQAMSGNDRLSPSMVIRNNC